MNDTTRFIDRYQRSPYHGVYPVAPTVFKEDGTLDLDGQRRCIDFLIDAGANGIGILANYSEQFSLDDHERELVSRAILEQAAGRVPVVITTSHFSTSICVKRCQAARDLGAAMVMVTPPYHGVGLRCTVPQLMQYLTQISENAGIPVMLQDAPMSGVELSSGVLAQIAADVTGVRYFKLETEAALGNIRALTSAHDLQDAIDGAWGGDCAVNLIYELDAGATGTMPGSGFTDAIARVFGAYRDGDRDRAEELYCEWLPLLHMERRIAGLQTSKVLMKAGGIIKCDRVRVPLGELNPDVRSALLSAARRLNPLVLQWA